MADEVQAQGLVLVISGPAGTGKTTLCERMVAEFPAIERFVTTTTRQPRVGEKNGVDYHFVAQDRFHAMIADGEFIEWAEVHGRFYGSEKARMFDALKANRDLLLNIDVQGADNYRKVTAPDPWLKERFHFVFLKPQSFEQIRERLIQRGSDDDSEIHRRLRTAEWEIAQAERFEHIIPTGDREADFSQLKQIYLCAKQRR